MDYGRNGGATVVGEMRTWAVCSCHLRVSSRPAQTQPHMYHFHFKRLLLGPPTLVNRSAITQFKLGGLGCNGHLMCPGQTLKFYQGSVNMSRDSSQMCMALSHSWHAMLQNIKGLHCDPFGGCAKRSRPFPFHRYHEFHEMCQVV